MPSQHSGEGEIRTPATLAGRPVFETGAFNHSATSPSGSETVADSAARVKTEWLPPSILPVRVSEPLGRRWYTAPRMKESVGVTPSRGTADAGGRAIDAQTVGPVDDLFQRLYATLRAIAERMMSHELNG